MKILIALVFLVGCAGVPSALAACDRMGMARECTPLQAPLITLVGEARCQAVKPYLNCVNRHVGGCVDNVMETYDTIIASFPDCNAGGGTSTLAECDVIGGARYCRQVALSDLHGDDQCQYWNCLKTHLDGCDDNIIGRLRSEITSYTDCDVDAGSSHVTVSAFAMILSLLFAAWRGFN